MVAVAKMAAVAAVGKVVAARVVVINLALVQMVTVFAPSVDTKNRIQLVSAAKTVPAPSAERR